MVKKRRKKEILDFESFFEAIVDYKIVFFLLFFLQVGLMGMGFSVILLNSYMEISDICRFILFVLAFNLVIYFLKLDDLYISAYKTKNLVIKLKRKVEFYPNNMNVQIKSQLDLRYILQISTFKQEEMNIVVSTFINMENVKIIKVEDQSNEKIILKEFGLSNQKFSKYFYEGKKFIKSNERVRVHDTTKWTFYLTEENINILQVQTLNFINE